MARHRGEYPADWPEIAKRRKDEEGWTCERCKTPHGPVPDVLTVHHLDGDKSNCADWNLAVLCQRCHLSVQGRVDMDQLIFDFRVSEWFRKHYEGWQKACVPTEEAKNGKA